MILYHFTAHHLASRILRDDITKGAIIRALTPKPQFRLGYIWLTVNPDPQAQFWHRAPARSSIPYSRLAVRFEVAVAAADVLTFLEACQECDVRQDAYAALTACPGASDWRIHRGSINRDQIIDYLHVHAPWRRIEASA